MGEAAMFLVALGVIVWLNVCVGRAPSFGERALRYADAMLRARKGDDDA